MWSLILCSNMRFFSSSNSSYELRSPPSLLLNGYWEFFPERVKL
jgi:hypothetical protein